MRFGPAAVRDALGCVLAHAIRLPSTQMKKGRVLDAADLDALAAAGIAEIVVACLEPDDVAEDAAAFRAAAPLAGAGVSAAAPFTGRVNLHAESDGLLIFDRDVVGALNRIDESLTLATLEPYAVVRPRQMVATVKVIPFAASDDVLSAWERVARPLRVAAFVPHRVALIQTTLPSLKPSVLDKTVAVTRARLAGLGSTLLGESRCAHASDAVAGEIRAMLARGAEFVLIAGASAIIDRRDVIPAGIVAAGGEIVHFGMPADPGNLLLLGCIGPVPVIGLPGCARSPRPNGFDSVLRRLIARLPVGPAEIMGLGVGGLLADTPSRGQPREPVVAPDSPRIAAIVLAAGRSSRMGGHKLLMAVDGVTLIERAVDAALASRATMVIVVLGHNADDVRERLGVRAVVFVENPDYADGLSTSLRAGVASVPADADGAVICLGDMPSVGPALIDRLIAAFNPVEGREVVVPMHDGRRGNPVLWGRRFFPELAAASGDSGAKHLLGRHAEYITEIEADDGVMVDIDTPEALAAFRARAVPLARD